MAVDWLPKYGRLNQIRVEATMCLNAELQKIVWDDVTGWAFVRKFV